MEPPARFNDRKRAYRQHNQTKGEMRAKAKAKEKKRERLKLKRKEKFRKIIKERAAEHRNNLTPSEARLWERLREWPKPYKCRSQHPIGFRIVDFVFCQQNIIVEVDGKYHLRPEQRASDHMRTAYLKKCGFRVIRFTNDEVDHQLEDVLHAIALAIGKQEMPASQLEEGDSNLWGDLQVTHAPTISPHPPSISIDPPTIRFKEKNND